MFKVGGFLGRSLLFDFFFPRKRLLNHQKPKLTSHWPFDPGLEQLESDHAKLQDLVGRYLPSVGYLLILRETIKRSKWGYMGYFPFIQFLFFPKQFTVGFTLKKKRGVHRLARACSVGRGLGVAWAWLGCAWLGRGVGVAWAWLGRGRGLGVAWAWLGRGVGVAWAWLGRGVGVAWAWLGRGVG